MKNNLTPNHHSKIEKISFRFVADDFGLSASTNEAILHSHQNGVLTSAALMMGQPRTTKAIEIAQAFPSLEIGLHFHLCDSIPLTVPHWPWNRHPASLGCRLGFQPHSTSLVFEEIKAQWNAFQKTGLPLAFVNFHHHLQAHPWIAYRLSQFLKEQKFQGWIRLGSPHFFSPSERWKTKLLHPLAQRYQKKFNLKSPQTLWGIDRTFKMNPQEILQRIGSLTNGIHELIFHPRQLNDLDSQCLLQLKQYDPFLNYLQK